VSVVQGRRSAQGVNALVVVDITTHSKGVPVLAICGEGPGMGLFYPGETYRERGTPLSPALTIWSLGKGLDSSDCPHPDLINSHGVVTGISGTCYKRSDAL
jgi:hypothetical protein